jgi:asparagine synthase (glutamine-hydrolysing)
VGVQFGRWNFDGRPVDREYLAKVRTLLTPYTPCSISECVGRDFFLLSGTPDTTQESDDGPQPFVSPAESYTWQGRLDNYSELMNRTNPPSCQGATDAELVFSMYQKDGVKSLGRLIGDWSLMALDRANRTLILAVDFLGACPLYYFSSGRFVAWSTVLEPLVLLSDRPFTICHEYVLGSLYGFPSPELTAYREIHAVPPSSYVEMTSKSTTIRKHWDFDPGKHLHDSTDTEYEEGFRHLFTQAVRRRLRSAHPVASELSGGMDSSSIVCVADQVLEHEPGLAPRLDTLSYLDDSEPAWNERPFVRVIEQARKRVGLHIDVSTHLAFIPERDSAQFPYAPSAGLVASVPQQAVSDYLRVNNIQVVLSGLGGDETTGGVPGGAPELADLFARARIPAFCRQAFVWALAERRPFSCVVGDVLSGFLPPSFSGSLLPLAKIPWLDPTYARRVGPIENLAPSRVKFGGPLPSFQENLFTLADLRRQIASIPPHRSPVRERRYPFLDRDLLEFLYSVPRSQLVRPERRRSLLRRALRGIVPEAVLERKRKAYVARAPLKSLQAECNRLKQWTKGMLCASIGAINLEVFQASLEDACRGNDAHLWRISRTLELESWLRDGRVQAVLRLSA